MKKQQEYKTPNIVVIDFISKNGLTIGGDDTHSTHEQLRVDPDKRYEVQEEDENEARRNHEVWDDEE